MKLLLNKASRYNFAKSKITRCDNMLHFHKLNTMSVSNIVTVMSVRVKFLFQKFCIENFFLKHRNSYLCNYLYPKSNYFIQNQTCNILRKFSIKKLQQMNVGVFCISKIRRKLFLEFCVFVLKLINTSSRIY